MRVCPKHWKPAIDTLKSYRDGTEYDLCEVCAIEFAAILHGESVVGPEGAAKIKEAIKDYEHGRKRVYRSPKKAQK